MVVNAHGELLLVMRLREDGLRRAGGNQHDRCVGVARDDHGHGRGIDHPKARNASESTVRIENREGVIDMPV